MVIKVYLLLQAGGGAPTAFSCSKHPLRKYHFGSGATQRLGKCLAPERTASSTCGPRSTRWPEKERERACCLATNAAGTLDGPGAEGAETAASPGVASLFRGASWGRWQERSRGHPVPPARPRSHEQRAGERLAPGQARPRGEASLVFQKW